MPSQTSMCMSGHGGMCTPAQCHGTIRNTCLQMMVITDNTVNKMTVGLHKMLNKMNKGNTGWTYPPAYTTSSTTLKISDINGAFMTLINTNSE